MPLDPTVRPAGARDTDAIAALLVDTFGEEEAALAEPWLRGPDGPGADWSVVVEGGEVVATSARLEKWWALDGAAVPVAQIEFVATRADHRSRGLVRAQFEHHHRRAATAGQVLHVVNGIPYFYRRFGYGYGLSYPALLTVGAGKGGGGRHAAGIVVREAGPADGPALSAFELTRPDAGMVRPDPAPTVNRRLWLAAQAVARHPGRPTERVLVAERGPVVGWVALQLRTADRRAYLLPGRAADTHAADALLDAAASIAATEGLPLIAQDTPDDAFGRRLRARSVPLGIEHGIYARVPHPVAMLRALGPVLERRLRASPFASTTGSVTISRFVDAVRIDHDGGRISAIDPTEPLPDPYGDGECGVAPDWFPALVLGRWGAVELARRADDVHLGRHADLLATLFPPCIADVAVDL